MGSLRVALACLVMWPAVVRAQTPARPSAPVKPRPDFSGEPFVVEKSVTTVRFENDGTGEEDLRARVRVQTDRGAKQWGELVFGYDGQSERVEIRSLRVRKSDGQTIEAGPDAASDVTAAAARDFPAFANCREKRVAVASLGIGDTLEYEVDKHIATPVAPGEFWFEHRFFHNFIVLDERVEINVPATRKLTMKSSAASYRTQQVHGRTIYSWKHTNLKHTDDSSQKATEHGQAKRPDIQLTTFGDWGQVALWFAKLEQGRREPSPEIQAKTVELTQGRTSGLEKARAIYDYVATGIRLVGLPLGAAGYRPRPAGEVFADRYGDSEDKHRLLAAMLQAAGISSYTALIASARTFDPAVASPAQFDHVITAVPFGKELVWMDSTVDVAPFRLLAAGFRGKPALLVSNESTGKIVETPADPPFLSTQRVDISGEVSGFGKLTATAHYSVRGDTELVLRSAFRKTPESQWKQLGQTILSLDGIHGEVTSVKSSDPTATEDPFQCDIRFAQSYFFDWASKETRAALPLLAIGLPDPPTNKSQPVELGSPLRVGVQLTLRLPPSFVAQPPVGVAITHDFAVFKTSYQFRDRVLTASRSLDFKMRELPATRGDEYVAFTRAVAADENQPLGIENVAPGSPTIPASATADELLDAGLASFNAGNSHSAIPLLERAVELEPRRQHAWNELGLAYSSIGKLDEGVAAFRRELEVSPADEHANEYLGLAFNRQQKYAEAAEAFRKQIEMNPLDPVAHAALGEIFLKQRQYAEAVTELEKATILSPENPELQVSLGRAYANTGKTGEAIAAFEKAASESRGSAILNEVAFALAEQKLALDKAQRYAEIAVADASRALRTADLVHVTDTLLDEVAAIAAYWDTLGWVYFQRGDPDRALPYIRVAWSLSQDGEAGDHLAQIYEKSGDKEGAIRMCALSLAAPNATPDTRARLTLLLGGNAQIDEMVSKAKAQLETLRTIPAGNRLAEEGRADFFVLLAQDGKRARVDAVKFIRGSEALRKLSELLRSIDYGTVFPDASPAKVIRRGTLACSRKTAECDFILIRPEDARASH